VPFHASRPEIRGAAHALHVERAVAVSQPDPRSVSPSGGPLLPRIVNAILLRPAFYEAVAADRHAIGPAGAIVCLAAIARESVGLYQLSQGFKAWGFVLALVAVFAIVRWLVYASIMYPIARAVAGTAVEYKRLLRCLGFAETPAMLLVVGVAVDEHFFPWIQFGVGAWLLAATVVAVRSAARVSTGRAVAIGCLGFAAYLALGVGLDFAAHMPDAPPAAPPP